jgi:hypothetical protein
VDETNFANDEKGGGRQSPPQSVNFGQWASSDKKTSARLETFLGGKKSLSAEL